MVDKLIYLIIFLLIVLLREIVKFKTLFSPLVIFNGIWFVTLSLYELKLSLLQQDLCSRTMLVFWIAVLSFDLIFLFLRAFKIRIKKVRLFAHRMPMERKRKYARWLAIVLFLIEIYVSGGVPLFWKLLGNSKIYFDFGIASLHGALCGLLICLGAYSLFQKGYEKWIYIAISLLIINRQVIMSILIEGTIYGIFTRNIKVNKEELLEKTKKIKWSRLFVLIILAISGFSIIGNFRSGNNVMNLVFQAKEQYENIPVVIKWIYSYMTFSISNFNNLVSITMGNINHGASMLCELLPTVLTNKIHINVKYSPYFLVSPNYTVSTYLPSIYLDFGLFGVALFNIVIGILGYSLYGKIYKSKCSRNILMYAVFVNNILLLFFDNMFLYLPVVIQFLYIPIIFSGKGNNDLEKRI